MMKNASTQGKSIVSFPYSGVKSSILECLKKEGYIVSFSKKMKKGFPQLEVELVYVDKKPLISNVQRISKLSKRVYVGFKEIYPIKNGAGILVLSTPKGILSGKEAKREHVGGEALFKIW